MKKRFENKVVLISGGSSGIGLALVKAFLAEGAKVCFSGRNEEKLNELRLFFQSEEVLVFKADVASYAECELLFKACVQKFGKIDILINNAGISMRANLMDAEISVIERLMQTNFMGMVYLTKLCLKEVVKNEGSIVSISSIAGYRGLPGRTGYSASKAAMNLFMDSLRVELLDDTKVQVLTVAPGFTASNIRNTALNAAGNAQGESPRNEAKMMSAEEVAAHTLKAIALRKKLLVLTPMGRFTIWLNKWFPFFTDKLVKREMAKEDVGKA